MSLLVPRVADAKGPEAGLWEQQKISLIAWIYVWGFFFFCHWRLQDWTEAGPTPAVSGILNSNNNKPVFGDATGLVGWKFATLPQHSSPFSWKSSFSLELKKMKLFPQSSMEPIVSRHSQVQPASLLCHCPATTQPSSAKGLILWLKYMR